MSWGRNAGFGVAKGRPAGRFGGAGEPPRFTMRQRTIGACLSVFGLALLPTSFSSSRPAQSQRDWKSATITMVNARAYQLAYAAPQDAVLFVEGDVTFPNGTIEPHFIRLNYDGRVPGRVGYCKFDIADARETARSKRPVLRLVRRCDGKRPQKFTLGDLVVSIAGHPIVNRGMPAFYVDSVGGSKEMTYHLGRAAL